MARAPETTFSSCGGGAGRETHGIGLQLGWCRPGSSSKSWHGPEKFGFSAILWRANRWNTPTVGRSINWRGHSQGATNPVENAILWRWRAPLGLLLHPQKDPVLGRKSLCVRIC